jgi:hypothetical protein
MKMKYFIPLIVLIAIFIQSYGQEKIDFFLKEYTISVNRTNVKDHNTENRNGIGIGAYHSFLDDKKLNLIFGFEYNRISQFKKSMYEGHFANSTDLTYTINCISIPFGLRFNIGNQIKVIIESGGFADLIFNSNRKGTMHTYFPDENYHIGFNNFQINENAELSNFIGIYFGLGVWIPIRKNDLIIKPDYKYGLTKIYSHGDDIYNRIMRLTIGLKIN